MGNPGTEAFGGLADVLEPDANEAASPTFRPSLRAAPVSIREPAQVQDFAFADTVSSAEALDERPASEPDQRHSAGPIFFDNADSSTQCVTPLAFPLPPAAADVAFGTRLRSRAAHLRHGLRRSVEEMRDLWRNAREIVLAEIDEGSQLPPASSFGFFRRRVLALWSCFQWSGGDVARAALIGAGVLLFAGVTFVSVTDHDTLASDVVAASADESSEVRVARTLDQHTGRKIVLHSKR